MSSHRFSQSTISCTKLCIKNNFMFKLMFSVGYFSPSTVYYPVGPLALILFCWTLSLPLSLPAYFPQRSTAFNNQATHSNNSLFSYIWHPWPLASFLRRLFGFLNARLSYQFPPRSLSFPLRSLASSASRLSVSSVYSSVPIFTGHAQEEERPYTQRILITS